MNLEIFKTFLASVRMIPFIGGGSIMLWILVPHLGNLKIPVTMYMMVILITGWQALNRWVGSNQPGSLLAFMGAFLFIVSDSILALDRFKSKLQSARVFVLSTYFSAQWLIALSISINFFQLNY